MGTPGDSPGSESSPPAVARDGSLRRDKNKVRVQWQILQTIQGIQELDKVSLLPPWRSMSFVSSLGEGAMWMCCLLSFWFVLWVVPLCGFTLHLWAALSELYKHQSLETIHMPNAGVADCWRMFVHFILWVLLLWRFFFVCLLVLFFNGSWFYHELWVNFTFIWWNRVSVWFAPYFSPGQ